MIKKSVKSINPSKSVIQTFYHIITKGHGGELKVDNKEARLAKQFKKEKACLPVRQGVSLLFDYRPNNMI